MSPEKEPPLFLDTHILPLGKVGYGLLLHCGPYRLNGFYLILLRGMEAKMCF